MLSFSRREKPGLSASSPGAVKRSGMVCVRIVAVPAFVVAVHVVAVYVVAVHLRGIKDWVQGF